MFKLAIHFLFIQLAFTSESSDILETLNLVSLPSILRTPKPSKLNLKDSCFPPLDNYQVSAQPVSESKYRGIARVIHSRSADIPHMCTAVCIDEAIFITAARCIYTLKVRYTSIMYMSKRFNARVFVVPSKPTKQMFDDIGIIVVDTTKAKGIKWQPMELFNAVNRTDGAFQWFTELNKKRKINYKVLGYAMKKGASKMKAADNKYDLTELDVVAAHDICFKILEQFRKSNGFGVPCYHSCNYTEFLKKNSAECKKYHGVEGGALLDTKSKKLIGIATWGVYYPKFELPVGFSAVNSENFFKDLTCAKRIRADNQKRLTKGYYQNLCDGN